MGLYFATATQRTLWGDDEYLSPESIVDLMRATLSHYPGATVEDLRRIAFLTHPATQNFLYPMLIKEFGSLDSAKVPVEIWLEKAGALETYARCARRVLNGDDDDKGARPRGMDGVGPKRTPLWYDCYQASQHYRTVRETAIRFWSNYMGHLSCIDNASHAFTEMHHRSYSRLGQDDEHRDLVPKCRECHESMRVRGPSIPLEAPKEVVKWL